MVLIAFLRHIKEVKTYYLIHNNPRYCMSKIWVAFCWIALLLCFCSKNSTPPTAPAPALYSNQDLVGSWLGTSYIPEFYPTVTIDTQAIGFSVFLVNGNLSVSYLSLPYPYQFYSINFNGSGAVKIEQGTCNSDFCGTIIYSGLMNAIKDSISGSITMISLPPGGFPPWDTTTVGTWSVTKLQ